MSFDADALVDRRRLRRKLTLWRVLGVLGVAVALVALVAAFMGERALQGDQIARFTVSGVITGARSELAVLDRIADEDRVKALIVRIDSPGGTTAGSEALYGALRRVAARKPVVAVVNTVAASGAYIAAIGTDRIVARRNSLVGSIGVLYQWPVVTELLNKLGISVNEVKSSPLKAVPNPFEPTSPEARAVIEDLVRDAYGWFIGLVSERRGLDPAQANTVGNGRVFTGGQAVGLKLVDQIGDERDAVAWLVDARGIERKLPVRDWRPRRDGINVDLTTQALAWVLDRLGLGSLAVLLDPQSNPLAGSGRLDGLLSLWQAPAASSIAPTLGGEP